MRRLCKDEVPGGRDPEVVVPIVVVPVVDVEAVLVEVADVDAIAVRVHNICKLPSAALEVETGI